MPVAQAQASVISTLPTKPRPRTTPFVTAFPGEIYRAPKSWTQQVYRKLIYFNEVDKGGHFAAWEEPRLFATQLRAACRTLR